MPHESCRQRWGGLEEVVGEGFGCGDVGVAGDECAADSAAHDDALFETAAEEGVTNGGDAVGCRCEGGAGAVAGVGDFDVRVRHVGEADEEGRGFAERESFDGRGGLRDDVERGAQIEQRRVDADLQFDESGVVVARELRERGDVPIGLHAQGARGGLVVRGDEVGAARVRLRGFDGCAAGCKCAVCECAACEREVDERVAELQAEDGGEAVGEAEPEARVGEVDRGGRAEEQALCDGTGELPGIESRLTHAVGHRRCEGLAPG